MDVLELFIEKNQKLLFSAEDEFSKSLLELSQSEVPPLLYGDRQKLYNADHRLLLYSWFIESICDFERFDKNTTKARVWSWVQAGLSKKFPGINIESALVELITLDLFGKFVENRDVSRKSWKIATKEDLIAQDSTPKCWICLRNFCDDAIYNFLNNCNNIDNVKHKSITLPSFVDFMFPRGLIEVDLSIQVEHITPFSLAKGDPNKIENLALSCGWCNLSKSNTVSIYTTNRNGKYYEHSIFGKRSIPNRYWIVKLLMTQRKCEICGSKPNTSENKLRLNLINDKGIANVSNLKVVCGLCDQIKGDRLVPSTTYKDRVTKKKFNLI
jgi:hypothetical protein